MVLSTHVMPTREDYTFLMNALSNSVPPPVRRRRVSFAPYVEAAAPGPLHFDEVSDLWYNRLDLASFKCQAKQLASSIRKGACLVHTDVRGLEHCTQERQKHRYMTIRCTLTAHRKGMSADQTASIARQCTAWSGDIAFVQGCHDYASVYQPHMTSLIPSVHTTPPEFPFKSKNKRSMASAHSQRCVRQRVVC